MAEALKPIVFRVGNELYGIDIQYVNAIEKDQDIVRVPNASSSICLLYTSPSPRDGLLSRMPSSA